MTDHNWTASEKKCARQAFDKALAREYAALLSEFKQQALLADGPEALWRWHDEMTERRKAIDQKYDYRYSRLISVFARLMAEQWLAESDLEGLCEEKMQSIRSLCAYFSGEE